MTTEEVIERVNQAMSDGFEIPKERLQPNAALFEDLKLDSLDAIDMLVYLEEELSVKVDAERFREVRVLGDVYHLVGDLVQSQNQNHISQNHP